MEKSTVVLRMVVILWVIPLVAAPRRRHGKFIVCVKPPSAPISSRKLLSLQSDHGRAKSRATVLFHQAIVRLKSRPRGFHLVTSEILAAIPEISKVGTGMLHLFLQHTSASLFLNENADPDVRRDFEHWSNQAIPDGASYFVHTLEGADDMPAHLKSGIYGTSQTIPVRDGRLLLGTWQGVYLGEHRDDGGSRTVVATLMGKE
jgi:secondary thiamine-phosphate synthase enzyme